MAHTASVGSVKRTVNVIGKRLGVKKFGGEFVKPGQIIIRQRGSEFYPGKNVSEGRDFTIFAVAEGFVSFRRMTSYKRTKKFVDVVSKMEEVGKELVKEQSKVATRAKKTATSATVTEAKAKKTVTKKKAVAK